LTLAWLRWPARQLQGRGKHRRGDYEQQAKCFSFQDHHTAREKHLAAIVGWCPPLAVFDEDSSQGALGDALAIAWQRRLWGKNCKCWAANRDERFGDGPALPSRDRKGARGASRDAILVPRLRLGTQ
jgi:hypothetical protein